MRTEELLKAHIKRLQKCNLCPNMIGPVITHAPVSSRVYVAGQAPGPREGTFGRPFAWTAGTTLFKWFSGIGLNEQQVRSLAYIGAICRCFPGKTSSGGDRVPAPDEVKACSSWMQKEFEILKPELVIPVGKVAIDNLLPEKRNAQLVDVIGQKYNREIFGQQCDIIPLPHPSGVSTWFKRDPGKSLTLLALNLIQAHPQWQSLCDILEHVPNE